VTWDYRRLNAIMTVVWCVMVPVALVTGWIYSVAFISVVSIYANIASHLAAWRADVPTARRPQK
jgi:predicted membrane chloride channel (bestrophin family)